jgi:Spy/CpxP family protein refolding chaperone
MRKVWIVAVGLGIISCGRSTATAVGTTQTTGAVVGENGASGAAIPTRAVGDYMTQAPPDLDPSGMGASEVESASVWHRNLLRASLDLGTLTSTQREQIQAILDQKESSGVVAAHKELLFAVADAVASNNVDPHALHPKAQKLAAALEASQADSRASLAQLHGILADRQRIDLVNNVKADMSDKPRLGGGWLIGPSSWMESDLGLTSAQENQINANLQRLETTSDDVARQETQRDHEAILDAFKGESFPGNRDLPATSPPAMESWATHLVTLAQASTPVLTEQQRSMEAAMFRSWGASFGK